MFTHIENDLIYCLFLLSVFVQATVGLHVDMN